VVETSCLSPQGGAAASKPRRHRTRIGHSPVTGTRSCCPILTLALGSSQLGCEILAKVIEETDLFNSIIMCAQKERSWMKRKEWKQVNYKGHTVGYIGEMMPLSQLSRAKQDMIVVSFHESAVAALGCVHFMPFVSLDRNCRTLRISNPRSIVTPAVCIFGIFQLGVDAFESSSGAN
jgi:hypothetical protein